MMKSAYLTTRVLGPLLRSLDAAKKGEGVYDYRRESLVQELHTQIAEGVVHGSVVEAIAALEDLGEAVSTGVDLSQKKGAVMSLACFFYAFKLAEQLSEKSHSEETKARVDAVLKGTDDGPVAVAPTGGMICFSYEVRGGGVVVIAESSRDGLYDVLRQAPGQDGYDVVACFMYMDMARKIVDTLLAEADSKPKPKFVDHGQVAATKILEPGHDVSLLRLGTVPDAEGREAPVFDIAHVKYSPFVASGFVEVQSYIARGIRGWKDAHAKWEVVVAAMTAEMKEKGR